MKYDITLVSPLIPRSRDKHREHEVRFHLCSPGWHKLEFLPSRLCTGTWEKGKISLFSSQLTYSTILHPREQRFVYSHCKVADFSAGETLPALNASG